MRQGVTGQLACTLQCLGTFFTLQATHFLHSYRLQLEDHTHKSVSVTNYGRWGEAKKAGRIVKFGGGFYCARVEVCGMTRA